MELLSEAGEIDSTLAQSFEDIGKELTLFEAGDVLFAKITPCMENGKGAFVSCLPTRYAFGSTEFLVLRAKHSVHPKFLYYYTFNPFYRAYAAENMSGAAGQKRVSSRFLKDTRLFLPRLPEQQRIAAYLDASCAAIDAAVAAKRRQIEVLGRLRLEALHATLARFADGQTERIKDVVVKIGSGVTPEGGAAGYLDEGIPLLRSQNVHFDGLRLDDVAFISVETHAEMLNSQVRPRDVLLNITGASIGRCTYVPDGFGEANVNQHVCIVRPGHRLYHEFLAVFLASPLGQSQIMSSFTGASRQGLSHKELGQMRIPLPPVKTQVDACANLRSRLAHLDRLTGGLDAQISTLTAYRKSLIYECVTGQRRVSAADVREIVGRASTMPAGPAGESHNG